MMVCSARGRFLFNWSWSKTASRELTVSLNCIHPENQQQNWNQPSENKDSQTILKQKTAHQKHTSSLRSNYSVSIKKIKKWPSNFLDMHTILQAVGITSLPRDSSSWCLYLRSQKSTWWTRNPWPGKSRTSAFPRGPCPERRRVVAIPGADRGDEEAAESQT